MKRNIQESQSFQEFIEEVKSHKCSQNPRIINWDRSENPSIFKIGFRCLDCGKVWAIGLLSVKKSTKALEDRGLSLFNEYNDLAKNKHGQILCEDFIHDLINKF